MLVDCHLVPKESWVPKIVSRIFTQLDKEVRCSPRKS